MIFLKLLDKIRYAMGGIRYLINMIEVIEGRYGSSPQFTPDIDRTTRRYNIAKDEVARHDSRLQQMVSALIACNPDLLHVIINRWILGHRVVRKNISKEQNNKYFDAYCRQRWQMWKAARGSSAVRAEGPAPVSKDQCKLCNEYYSTNRGMHMKSCTQLNRVKGQVVDTDRLFLDYYSELDKEIEEKSAGSPARPAKVPELRYATSTVQRSSLSGLVEFCPEDICGGGRRSHFDSGKAKEPIAVMKDAAAEKADPILDNDTSKYGPRVLRKLSVKFSPRETQANPVSYRNHPQIVNRIRTVLQNFKLSSSPGVPPEEVLPPIPRTPVLRKRERIEQFKQLMAREDLRPSSGERQLSSFANAADDDEKESQSEQNAQTPTGSDAELEEGEEDKNSPSPILAEGNPLERISPVHGEVEQRRRSLLKSGESGASVKRKSSEGCASDMGEDDRELEVLKQLKGISRRAYDTGQGASTGSLVKVTGLLREIEATESLGRGLPMYIKTAIHNLKENCMNKVKLLGDLMNAEKETERDRKVSDFNFSSLDAKDSGGMFDSANIQPGEGESPLSRSSFECIFPGEDSVADADDGRASFLGSSKQLFAEQLAALASNHNSECGTEKRKDAVRPIAARGEDRPAKDPRATPAFLLYLVSSEHRTVESAAVLRRKSIDPRAGREGPSL